MQLKRLLIVLPLLASLWGTAQKNDDILNYINSYKELAIQEMQRTGVPASIKLAQGIHETMAGKSDLVLRSNNHFGIKCKNTWSGNKVYHDDDARGECFRSYSSSTDSYMDHSNFLKGSPRYSSLFSLDPTDYKGWAYGLKKAGYATNIRYSQILVKLIDDYNLNQYTLIAMGRLSAQDEILAGEVKKPGTETIVESAGPAMPVQTAVLEETMTPAPVVQYPAGEFTIHNTKVIFAKAGTALLAVAKQYDISLRRLLDFNDLKREDVLVADQLLYLQRKRKTGANEFHTVQPGESLYFICQAEAIRFETLLEYNHLDEQSVPAVGEKLYLHTKAPARPRLAGEVTMVSLTTTDARPAFSGAAMHIVQTKETLFSIAKKYGITVEQLKEWNKLTGYELKIGQELIIYKN